MGAALIHALRPATLLRLGRQHSALEFVRRVYDKAGQDAIFFMAGAISFSVLAALIPLVLFVVGLGGFFLAGQTERFGDPTLVLLDFLARNLPSANEGFIEAIESPIRDLLANRGNLTGIGALLLVWFSTRLIGTLRTALEEIFDITQDRGIIEGKIFDMLVVMIGGGLFLLNIAVTFVLTAAKDFGLHLLGLDGFAVSLIERAFIDVIAFSSIWVLFAGIYRYLPARQIPWRTTLTAATFAAILHELLKWAFGAYATNFANYESTYGNLITLAIFVFWIYYEALVFIIAGECAQVWTMRRALRVRTRGALFEDEDQEQ